MTRPVLTDIENGQEAWDVDINDNNNVLVDGPFPVFEAADFTDLTTNYPAGSFDRCLAAVTDTSTLYISDGTTWQPFAQFITATETQEGVAEVATAAETTAGVLDDKIITPLKLQQKVDTIIAGIDIKAAVDTSTFGLGNITLSGEQTLNGLLTSASRVLVTDQTLPEENGIYVSAAGAWARAADADEDAEVTNGNITHVLNSGSTVYQYKYMLVTADPITVGTTGQSWEEHRDIDQATETLRGSAELATQAETDAGTDDLRIVTPLKLANTTVPGIDTDAIHDNVAGEINAIANKASPTGADCLIIEDAADSFNKKKVAISNLPGGADADAVHVNVANEINAIAAKGLPTPADYLIVEDAADFGNKKSITLGNLPRQDNTSFTNAESTTASYATPAGGQFGFGGTNTQGTPRKISVVGGFIGTGTAAFRVQDITNSLTIAEVTLNATVFPAMVDLGTVSNLSTGPAVWEVQFQRDGGTGGANRASISGVVVEF